jgi:deoxyribodipyrimidine photo-lyase
VCDFNPLRTNRAWQQALVEQNAARVERVDAHNVVPCTFVSDKTEFAARTIRPKIHRQLERFLVETPAAPEGSPAPWDHPPPAIDWSAVRRELRCDRDVPALDWLVAGEGAARAMLDGFLSARLAGYDKGRNDPNLDAQSDLSPYLHFGHISAQRVAAAVRDSGAPEADVAAFLEELIVRRELSDNFCYFNPDYDRFAGFHAWAQKTLDEHRDDPRDPCYERATLDAAQTHDPLWNAAQTQLVESGKMHGYLRMYWAKKILQWTASPEEALATGIALNDRYSIDGRDPNGYVGVAWSVGGVHDRAWQERPIFGKVRYMSYAGCRRKFKVDAYVERWLGSEAVDE